MLTQDTVNSEQIGHLGLIAATIKELGLIERIDARLALVQGGAANIPLWMEALDGNSSDKTSFQETVRKIKAFTQNLQNMPDNLFFVVDAAFYMPEQLAKLNEVFWITQVPAQLKEAKALINTASNGLVWEVFDENYRGSVYEAVVFGSYALDIYGLSTTVPATAFTHRPRSLDNNKKHLSWCEM